MTYSILIAASGSDDEDDGHAITITAELPGSPAIEDTGLAAANSPQAEDAPQRNTRRRAAPGAGEDPQAVAGKRRSKVPVDLNDM